MAGYSGCSAAPQQMMRERAKFRELERLQSWRSRRLQTDAANQSVRSTMKTGHFSLATATVAWRPGSATATGRRANRFLPGIILIAIRLDGSRQNGCRCYCPGTGCGIPAQHRVRRSASGGGWPGRPARRSLVTRRYHGKENAPEGGMKIQQPVVCSLQRPAGRCAPPSARRVCSNFWPPRPFTGWPSRDCS